jgi:outer membrane protein OmpU
MDNIKKIGLTALAGSLVAVSAANAGSLSVSGGAKIGYAASDGNEDLETDGNRFGMQKSVSFSGTGELDNGNTISLTHNMAVTGALSTSVLKYDMGDMGSITYSEDSGDVGIGKIDDIMPTAEEEVTNGIDADAGSSNETLVGKVDGGMTGFNYVYTMDMATIQLGYSPKTTSGNNDDGSNSGAGGLKSSTSIAVTATPMDGLTVFGGTGDKGTGTQEDDHDTYGVIYAFGPITVGYQHSEIDFAATTSNDLETDSFGISFQVNDDLSISYGEQETEAETSSTDQEVDGMSIAYSMGSISIAAHANEAKNIANQTANESTHTEISINFAF